MGLAMSSSVPPLLANATRDLARFAAETRPGDIPATVIERVKLSWTSGGHQIAPESLRGALDWFTPR